MALKLLINAADPPVGALIVSEILGSKFNNELEVVWSNDFGKKPPVKLQLLEGKNEKLVGEKSIDVARYLARAKSPEFYGSANPFEKTEVDHWLLFADRPFNELNKIEDELLYLDRILAPRTWLVAKHLTIADICVFSRINDELLFESLKEKYPNIYRWYRQIIYIPEIQKVLALVYKDGPKNPKIVSKPILHKKNETSKQSTRNKSNEGTSNNKEQGKFIDLPGAEMGKVIVRFPPEASGFLHIGHAKAALLNQYYAENFKGQLIMRFDDTNPAKENVEFEKAILEDLEMLQIKPDRFTHSSDYFDLMLEYCEKLLKDGKAYADDTPAAEMKEQRDQKLPSANHDNSVEKNLALWREMIQGTTKGQECCIRAKIDYKSPNGCMRDPTIYRCKPEPHPRTGTKYKVYPTYDFACPIVDAVENVTHTLRTTEYHDRDDQFYWFVDALGLRRPYIYEYSRLNMMNTVLSKRKLTWFVAEGLVDGWDDPRFPTVRGILRRGMTVEGLKQFIIAQGSSRSVVFMGWDKIWAFNKKVIDPVAIRYTALTSGDTVPVNVKGVTETYLTVANHPKDSNLGTKQVRIGPKILIEKEDAEALKEGHNATFINWGNLMIEKIKKENGKVVEVDASPNLDNKDFKNTLKLTWICADAPELKSKSPKSSAIPCYAVYFEHIMTKSILAKDDDFKDFVAKDTRREIELIGEAELRRVKKGEIIQLQRKGFFRCDVPYAEASAYSSREQPLILFHIPDGHASISLPGAADKTTAKESKKETKIGKSVGGSAAEINDKIIAQGAKVRDLKSAKADKAAIDAAVKILLSLKADYKSVTGEEWKPNAAPVANSKQQVQDDGSAVKLNDAIIAQGLKVRDLKAAKSDKATIDCEVKDLLSLKAKYKTVTGQEWKPNATPVVQKTDVGSAESINEKIVAQGNKVRDLKGAKADKATVDAEVKLLLSLKSDYKSITGQDWKPNAIPAPKNTSSETKSAGSAESINEKIVAQGNKVRDLKGAKADKATIDAEVKLLLSLKSDYKSITGQDWKPNAIPAPKNTSAETKSAGSAESINEKIVAQGNKVRDLKSAKADKATVDAEVKLLLSLKSDYKSITGQDWKPNAIPAPKTTSAETKSAGSAESINEKIVAQGNKVRDLKSAKADKAAVDAEVKTLLSLKADYKLVTGQEWKPGATASVPKSAPKQPQGDGSADNLNQEIVTQGNKVRELKSAKAAKATVDEEIKILLNLKDKYKALTGQDWKPGCVPPAKSKSKTKPDLNALFNKILEQNDLVKNFHTNKLSQIALTKETVKLLNLKSEYKNITGRNWPAGLKVESPVKETQNTAAMAQSNSDSSLEQKIIEQGNKVRDLKAKKADNNAIQQEVQTLLALKSEYKTVFGKEYVPANTGSAPRENKAKAQKPENAKPANKSAKKQEAPKDTASMNKDDNKTGTRLGLEAKKLENLPDWYSQVITKGEMIDYYDVSGCYILRPWSYAIWEVIKDFFDAEIKKLGVKNCYFPCFVSKAVLEKEKTHIADFAPEVAWVTKSGDSELAEPIAIRPTSETVMYPSFAKWLKSHRDLPLKLNQWNNVVRWEFKHPQPFLRTREFLWQEGHTAFATKAEADEEVLIILDLYAKIYEEFLAIPVVKGRKTEKEKFAGGDYTTTVEAFVSASGRAIQGGTSHHLGQNFSKMFDIQVEGAVEGGEKTFVYQNSWGITTRTIGVMIMVHGDDKGLVLPPKVAAIQAVVVPCGITAKTTEEQRNKLYDECIKLEKELSKDGQIRVEGDYRDNYSPGWKFNHWELKGVPVRVELGPKDLEKAEVTFVRRDTAERITAKRTNAQDSLVKLLNDIQSNLFEKAKIEMKEHIKQTHVWNEFCSYLDGKNLILAPFCGRIECEDKVKADSVREDTGDDPNAPSMGAKSLCIPFNQPDGSVEQMKKLKCIHPACQEKPKFYTLFGRSY